MSDDWEAANMRIQNLFCIVTEDEPDSYGLYSDAGGPYTTQEIWDAFDRAGIRASVTLEADVRNALNGDPLLYFQRSTEIVEAYRGHYAVYIPERPSPDFTHISAAVQEVIEIAEERRANPNYSIYAAAEFACPQEQRVFYKSHFWRNRARAVRAVARGCRCRRRNVELHAHHNEPIYSAYSRLFYRNFELNRIRVLCKVCHDELHQRLNKTLNGFSAVNEGPDWNQARRIHDAHPEECPWCATRGMPAIPYGEDDFDFNAPDRLPF